MNNVTYAVKYSHSAAVETYESAEDAESAIRSVFGADTVLIGDLPGEGVGHTAVAYRDQAAADADINGGLALAVIREVS